MPAPAIGLRRNWSPPASAAVEWSNSLTAHMQLAWLASADIDLANRRPPVASAAMTPVISVRGVSLFGNGSGFRQFPISIAAAAPYSVLVVGHWTNAAAPNWIFSMPGGSGYQAAIVWNTPLQLQVAAGGGNAIVTDAGGNTPSGKLAVGFTYTTGGVLRGFANGAYIGTTTAAANANAATVVDIGRYSTNYTNGASASFCCVWRRALSDAEMLALHDDPFQFLRY